MQALSFWSSEQFVKGMTAESERVYHGDERVYQ